MPVNPSDEELATLLRDAQRVAVVGWSSDASRDSHRIADYLDAQGYQVLPVNPNCVGEQAYGTTVVGTMTELDDIDIVDVFRRSEAVTMHVDEALELGAPVFWMQLGIRNEEAAGRLREGGVTVLQDRCILVEHRRLLSA